MEKKVRWVKSLVVVMAVLVAISSAGIFVLTGEQEAAQSGTVEAASFMPVELPQDEQKPGLSASDKEPASEENAGKHEQNDPVVGNSKSASEDNTKAKPLAVQTSAATIEKKAESEPVVTVTETPAAQPAVTEAQVVKVEQPQITTTPVSYNWGSSANYVFRMEVKVSNSGSETAKNVSIAVPLLENSSPYQTTSLRSVNYEIIGSSGRVSTFNLGDIAPGETKTIVADFDINVRSLAINSSNETLDRARKIYEQYAGSGNCRDLARAFISKCQEQGITAREVIGFARTQRGAMTSGSLQGCRHSWAEIYVEGLGWVPVDLTFQYFGAFPHTSHIVESYGDQSIKVTYTGGTLSASWSNAVM